MLVLELGTHLGFVSYFDGFDGCCCDKVFVSV